MVALLDVAAGSTKRKVRGSSQFLYRVRGCVKFVVEQNSLIIILAIILVNPGRRPGVIPASSWSVDLPTALEATILSECCYHPGGFCKVRIRPHHPGVILAG